MKLLDDVALTIQQLKKQNQELIEQNENLLYLLERIKLVVPTYYGDLINEINQALKNNKN